ncbi:hypothetical protein DAPPUDRAFT_236924 [Daphnia pulex]|uniref:Uncharacterized protein n=1 Tax=Daphnia pulex TaxID=6669 RepID=E9G2A2_DAPPU|nr:hypothetical protein DAPPUDRAFT_236924 [Daphnia pulex]|eukprot:EFX86339.1 hypothetical protein DAPPUDRAFT_236924 [Daphnia pulex]
MSIGKKPIPSNVNLQKKTPVCISQSKTHPQQRQPKEGKACLHFLQLEGHGDHFSPDNYTTATTPKPRSRAAVGRRVIDGWVDHTCADIF